MKPNYNYKIASVVFEKDKIGLNEAFDWIVNNNYKVKRSVENDSQYIFTQFSNKYLKCKGYNNCITKQLNEQVNLIIAFKI